MALIPAGYMKAIVSLGVSNESFDHIGAGFLYHHPVWEKGSRTHCCPSLVTNKHVMEMGIRDVRFNHPGYGSLEILPIASVTDGDWTPHPNGADVAVIPLLSPGPLTLGRKVMETEIFLGDVSTHSDEEFATIAEGNGIFLIGFPLGITGDALPPIHRRDECRGVVKGQESAPLHLG